MVDALDSREMDKRVTLNWYGSAKPKSVKILAFYIT